MEYIKRRNHRTEIMVVLLLAFSLFLGIMAMFKSTEHILYGIPFRKHFILMMLSMGCWLAAQILVILSRKTNVLNQFIGVDIVLVIMFGTLCTMGWKELEIAEHREFWRSYIVICLASIIPVLFYLCYHKRKETVILWKNYRKWIANHRCILLIEIIALVIAIIQSGSEPRWDGAYVYQYIHDEISISDIFNLSRLSFCGHIDMTYIAMNKILAVLFDNLLIGMTVGTIILLLVSTACMYGVIKYFIKDRSDLEYSIMTVIYVASPYILGLAGYNYWDSWVVLLFPLLIYTSLNKQWITHIVIAFIFCFVKETAIVAYAGYAVGLVLTDWIGNRNIKSVVKAKQYWGMLGVGLSWLYLYVKLPHWDGVGEFTFNGTYILEKLKVMYVLNFNWVLSILGFVAIVALILKKRIINRLTLPILLSDVFFVGFSCLFQTVNHARYIDTHIIVLILLALMGIQFINRRYCRYILSIIIIVLMLISNYITIDPLTKKVFPNYYVGKTDMISTCQGEYLSDSMVYNQQYRYFDRALDEALKNVVDEEHIIFYPVIGDRTWFFMGYYNKVDEPLVQYWDTEQKKHILYETESSSKFTVCNITSARVAEELLQGQEGYYFYVPCAGENIADELRAQTKILEEQDFTYRNWTVTRIKFVKSEENR